MTATKDDLVHYFDHAGAQHEAKVVAVKDVNGIPHADLTYHKDGKDQHITAVPHSKTRGNPHTWTHKS